jgi:hypothetical protein
MMSAELRDDRHGIPGALALHLESFSVQHIGERYIDALGLRPTYEIPNTAVMSGAFEPRHAQA